MNQNPTPGSELSETTHRRRVLIGLALAGGFVLLVIVSLLAGAAGAPQSGGPTSTNWAASTTRPLPSQVASAAPISTFDKTAHSVNDPTSIWVVSNKQRPLNPVNYVPKDLVTVPVEHTWTPELREEASDAIVALFEAADDEADLTLSSNSAYRSYSSQVKVYDEDVAKNGKAFADKSTARPGYSEHQTGLALDIGADSGHCSLETCFADTGEGKWLATNAWRFGFILRYPADKTDITGFAFEPWHYRYVGVPLATEMHNTGVTTLEEFFELPVAPSY